MCETHHIGDDEAPPDPCRPGRMVASFTMAFASDGPDAHRNERLVAEVGILSSGESPHPGSR